MWSNKKIIRRAKRTLKRMKCYLESRDASRLLEYAYELDFVLIKTDTAVAYAHFGDEIIKFNPFKNDVTAQSVLDWSFSLDSDLFFIWSPASSWQGYLPESIMRHGWKSANVTRTVSTI